MSSAIETSVRADFPLFESDIVYLDSAATALKPKAVIDAISDYYQKPGTVHRALYELSSQASTQYELAREKVQKFLGAKRKAEIIFTRGTTDSINLISNTFPLSKGDEIYISAMEHHSNIVPWQMRAQKTGAVLKIIPVTKDGDLDLSNVVFTEKTKLISIAHMTNVTGTIYPIQQVIEMAHAVGAKVFVDGAQAAPHLQIDVQKLDVDFYAFSAHKLYGPTGIGILYGKYDLLEALPPYQGGSDMIDEVSLEHFTYQKPPLKFEAGTPSIAQVMGLGAAIDYLEGHRHPDHEKTLLDYALAKLQAIPGLRVLGNPQDRGPLVTFVIDGAHPADLGTLLDLKGVCVRTGHLCSQPTMQHFGITVATRISLGLYNMQADIDTFIKALDSVLKQI